MSKNCWGNEISEVRKTFGSLLREYREKAGLSQRKLALEINTSQTYIADLENGGRTPPTDQRLEKMADTLKLSPLSRSKLYRASEGIYVGPQSLLFLSLEQTAEELEYGGEVPTMAWVVGNNPPEFREREGPFLDSVLRHVTEGSMWFTYWVPRSKLAKFDEFRELIESGLTRQGIAPTRTTRSLECIATPDILCTHQLTIYNPLSPKRVGRFSIPNEQDVVTAYSLPSSEYINRVCKPLDQAYPALISEKDATIQVQESADEPGSKSIELRFHKHFP